MTDRVHSRLIIWNFLVTILAAFILTFFLTASQAALFVIAAFFLTLVFSYGVRIMVGRPLGEIAPPSRKLASGNFDQRLPTNG
jgi:hypothetical protein